MSNPPRITELLSEFKSLIILIVILILSFAGGFFFSQLQSQKAYDLLLGENTKKIEELSVTKNRVVSLKGLLSDKNDENAELKEIIKSYENRPKEIEYVVITETVFVGEENRYPDLPNVYLYTFENGMPVAIFKVEEDDYLFKTFDISFSSTVVVSEDETAVLLKAKSSYDDVEHKIEIDDVSVNKVRDQKLIEPHIQVSLTGSLNMVPPSGDLSVSLSTPWLHPKPNLDILSPRISGNSSSFRAGIDFVSYNIGDELPVFTDLWLGLGASTVLVPTSSYSIDVTIGSKF